MGSSSKKGSRCGVSKGIMNIVNQGGSEPLKFVRKAALHAKLPEVACLRDLASSKSERRNVENFLKGVLSKVRRARSTECIPPWLMDYQKAELLKKSKRECRGEESNRNLKRGRGRHGEEARL